MGLVDWAWDMELGKPVYYVPMYWLDNLREVLELVVDDLDELPYWGA